MSEFVTRYKPYNDYLIDTLGIDWYRAQEEYKAIGNGPGVYPDVCMLLAKFVERPDIETIVELGSGTSTLFLSAAARCFGKILYTFEEGLEWAYKTSQLLGIYGLDRNIVRPFIADLPAGDLVFIDCQDGSRQQCIEKSPAIADARYVLLDDAEYPHFTVPVVRSLTERQRYNFTMFNPVDRQDRHVLINPKDSSFRTTDWIWTWKPDRIYW